MQIVGNVRLHQLQQELSSSCQAGLVFLSSIIAKEEELVVEMKEEMEFEVLALFQETQSPDGLVRILCTL